MIARGYNLSGNLCNVNLKVFVSSKIDKKFILIQKFLEDLWQNFGVSFIVTNVFCSGSLLMWIYINIPLKFLKKVYDTIFKIKKELDNFEIGG